MDIQHSDIGCNKHQTIPAFGHHEEDEIMDNSISKKDGWSYYNVALYKEQSCMQNFF